MVYNTPQNLIHALCFELPQDGSVPEWVQLLPSGERVIGVDGRQWVNDKPERVLARFNDRKAQGRNLVFDYEHSTELKAPNGEEAPATAWGVEMEIREGGSIWVKPEWTERGHNSVASMEYRYLSPVLIYEKVSNRIVAISSVGLTNRPNLTSKALNRESSKQLEPDTETSKAIEEINEAFGFKYDVANNQGLVEENKAMNAEHADIAAQFGNSVEDIAKYG